jgi:hypothetical protein
VDEGTEILVIMPKAGKGSGCVAETPAGLFPSLPICLCHGHIPADTRLDMKDRQQAAQVQEIP